MYTDWEIILKKARCRQFGDRVMIEGGDSGISLVVVIDWDSFDKTYTPYLRGDGYYPGGLTSADVLLNVSEK